MGDQDAELPMTRLDEIEAEIAREREEVPDGAAVLDEVAAWLSRYLSVPSPHYFTVCALWAAHTHAAESFYVTPRLILDSAEPESGKSRVLELLNLLTRAPILTMNTTIAALYRRLAGAPRTILLDETDAIFSPKAAQNHEDLRALLNAGYKRGATVDRCVGDGKDMKVVEFPVFAPAALAGIAGNMPATITTRAVTLHMRRRAPDEELDEFLEEDVMDEAAPLRESLDEWITAIADTELKGARPAMPDGVRDRAAEVWRALLAVADAAGGHWPDTARAACRYFALDSDPEELSLGMRLLSDLRDVFGDRAAMATPEILEALHTIEDAPWATIHRGNPLTADRLRRELKKHRVSPKVVKVDGKPYRGFHRDQLVDLWRRYLDPAQGCNRRNHRNHAGHDDQESYTGYGGYTQKQEENGKREVRLTPQSGCKARNDRNDAGHDDQGHYSHYGGYTSPPGAEERHCRVCGDSLDEATNNEYVARRHAGCREPTAGTCWFCGAGCEQHANCRGCFENATPDQRATYIAALTRANGAAA